MDVWNCLLSLFGLCHWLTLIRFGCQTYVIGRSILSWSDNSVQWAIYYYILNEMIMIPSVAVPFFFFTSVVEVVLEVELTNINIFFFNLCNSEFVYIYILIQCFQSLRWSLPWPSRLGYQKQLQGLNFVTLQRPTPCLGSVWSLHLCLLHNAFRRMCMLFRNNMTHRSSHFHPLS